jgi:hypothetical protein
VNKTDVELLREAAAKMRERAEAATPGPWRSDGEMVKSGESFRTKFVAEAYGLADKWPNAEHIASWHPAVALAVADWLDTVYDRARGKESVETEPAMVVARAYMGGGS